MKLKFMYVIHQDINDYFGEMDHLKHQIHQILNMEHNIEFYFNNNKPADPDDPY
ncbi:hypothetical protein RhiirA1_485783 [Rhizophagus irregularis]|uniref:Uncharacterized protein n=1 Tax=Rhizophagus irregularis TaxID=588596 RepID=A0A2N0QHT9_9GLOM|nr:hypothetical protein RhiirA1_485783 [Rhizophagus irregularis]